MKAVVDDSHNIPDFFIPSVPQIPLHYFLQLSSKLFLPKQKIDRKNQGHKKGDKPGYNRRNRIDNRIRGAPHSRSKHLDNVSHTALPVNLRQRIRDSLWQNPLLLTPFCEISHDTRHSCGNHTDTGNQLRNHQHQQQNHDNQQSRKGQRHTQRPFELQTRTGGRPAE